jgi:hypothetical protein
MEVKINGTKANLGNSYPAITRKVVDINDPSARFADFTNRFELPDTPINRTITENPEHGTIGSNNRSFDKLYDVEIDDVFQIFKGKGFLDSSTPDKLNLQCVDNSKELFKGLDIKLNALSWEDKDTILTQTAINALDTIDITTCWFWGKACYHQNAIQINTDQTTGDDRCKYSRPAFYVQGLLNRAVVNAGYTLTAPLPDLALSSNHKDFFFTSYQKTISATFNPAGTLAITGLDTNDFAHTDLTVISASINIGAKKTKFRLRGQVTSNAVINIIIRATVNGDPTKVVESKSILPTSGVIDFTTSEFYSATGMTIDIRLEGTGNVVMTDTLLYTVLSDRDADLSINSWLNYKIKAYDNLPDLTYLDLYRLICVTSNQFHIVDNYNRVLSFGSLATINKNNSRDWSTKFIQQSEITTAQFPGLFQKNWLKYENDLTVNPQLGWSFFNTDNESLQKEGDYLVLKFGASNDVLIGSNTVGHIPIYNDTTRITEPEITIRLFSVVGDKLQFAPVDWANIAATYYANWFRSLYRIRQIDCEFNLSKLDVLRWNPKQLVYIDYFKSTFIVLEISDFISGRKTKVKLLNYGR